MGNLHTKKLLENKTQKLGKNYNIENDIELEIFNNNKSNKNPNLKLQRCEEEKKLKQIEYYLKCNLLI